jgi:hypothetical protein
MICGPLTVLLVVLACLAASLRETFSLLDRQGNDLVPDLHHDDEGRAFVVTDKGVRWVRSIDRSPPPCDGM